MKKIIPLFALTTALFASNIPVPATHPNVATAIPESPPAVEKPAHTPDEIASAFKERDALRAENANLKQQLQDQGTAFNATVTALETQRNEALTAAVIAKRDLAILQQKK